MMNTRVSGFQSTFEPFTHEDYSYLFELVRVEERHREDTRHLVIGAPEGLADKLKKALGI